MFKFYKKYSKYLPLKVEPFENYQIKHLEFENSKKSLHNLLELDLFYKSFILWIDLFIKEPINFFHFKYFFKFIKKLIYKLCSLL